MSSNVGARRDLLRRISDLEQEVELMRRRRKGHCETKTFIVPGPISEGMYIPPFFVGVDPIPSSDPTPEFKRIIGYKAVLRVGTAYLGWDRNGAFDLYGHDVTAVAGEFDETLGTAIDVTNGDVIRPTVEDASGDASDLAAAVFFVTAAR